MIQLYTLIIIIIVVFVAITGGVISNISIKKGWYSAGVHTNIPPNYVFFVVWTLLYIIYFLVWNYLANKVDIWINILFFFNMLVNLFWVYIFFAKGDVMFSQLIILILIILTVVQISIVYSLRKKLIYYRWCILGLVLYLIWLCIATYLNFSI